MDYAIQGLIQAVTPFLDAKADIYHQQSTRSSTGGVKEGYPSTPDVAQVPCQRRPAPTQPQRMPVALQVQSLVTWVFRFPAGTDVRPSDRIVCNGTAYVVMGEFGPNQSANVNTLVYVTEFRP